MSLHHARSSALLVALCVGAAVLPASLLAQQIQGADRRSVLAPAVTVAAPVRDAAAVPAPVVGPRAIPAGITTTTQAGAWDVARAPDDRSVGAGTNLALMGAGAAAVVIGLLIGGDGGTIIAVGGGVIALVGFFRFLR